MSSYSVNRILGNDRNAVREAALVASALRASTELRLTAETRQGNGQVALSGAYTGAADTTVDVEVIAGDGTALRPSAPVIAGVGSGALSVLSVDAAAVPETVTLRLVEAETPATHAELPFFGATLRARVAGTAGNALTLTVTRNLVETETQYATLEAIEPGAETLSGAQWDWGAVPGDGVEIPTTAARLRFAGHAQVFRHWREWDGGAWVYRLDPAPEGAVAADTRLLAISGDYRLSLSDGSATETYDAVTVFDALRLIKARSALVEVVGVVSEDRAPGGMAVTDIPLRTDAHALPVEAQIQGAYGVPRLDAITVDSGAPTEAIFVERQSTGRWSVAGSVSGALGTAQAGTPFASPVVGFTIPAGVVPPAEQGDILGKYSPTSRATGESLPAVCITPKRGAAATPKQITFVYTQRNTTDCSCDNLPVPFISDACLGLAEEGDLMSLPAEVASRVAAVYDWRKAFARSNTAIWEPSPQRVVPAYTIKGEPTKYAVDLYAELSKYVTKTVLNTNGSGDSQDWTYDDVTVLESFWVFRASSQQTWPTDYDADVVVGLVSGSSKAYSGPNRPQKGERIWVNGVGFTLTTSMVSNIAEADKALITYTATRRTIAGTSDVTVPAETIAAVQGGLISADDELSWMQASLDILLPCLAEVYDTPAALAAWDALWTEVQGDLDTMRASAQTEYQPMQAGFLTRYRTACDAIRIQAGIYPSFDLASSDAGACWQDDDSASYWWVETSGEYLPAFTGKGYVSAKRVAGRIVPTKEFGFGLTAGCEGALKVGDLITITVRGAAADGYAAGDRYRLPIVAAAPAVFGGGLAGDDTHTWTARGSVTGAWSDWAWSPSAPADYVAGLATLRLAAGGIPWTVGDQITFGLEGGRLRWRRDAGAWTEADLYGAAPDLGDGLALDVSGGPAPSFVAGDAWTFAAIATHGPERLRSPREGRAWTFDGAGAVFDVDLGSVQPIEAVLIALHSLPVGAGIAISGGDAAVGEWSLAPAWRSGPILAVAAEGTTARYLRLTLSGCGAGASVGWLWAGVPWAPTAGVSSMDHVRQYGLTRTNGRNPGALYRGRGTGGRWSWSLDAGAALLPADVSGLLAMLDHVAEQGLEWVCLVPDIRTPSGATLAQIDADEVSLTEHLGYLYEGQALTSVDLPFRAVLA